MYKILPQMLLKTAKKVLEKNLPLVCLREITYCIVNTLKVNAAKHC